MVTAALTERDSPALAVATAVWCVTVGLIGLIGAVVRVLERPDQATGLCSGAWLGLAGAVLIVLGAWLVLRDERPSRYRPGAARAATAPLVAAARPPVARGRSVECATVIRREEVLHVARLARLALREEEIEPMARELSAVLDHVATIGELDLDQVPPTSHVVEVTGRLRPDEPRPCLPREVVLSQAPAVDQGGFLVPSPQA